MISFFGGNFGRLLIYYVFRVLDVRARVLFYF